MSRWYAGIMAGKPELSAAPGVQNVVVYVSNDNFAQAYTVNHHGNHAPSPQQHQHHAPDNLHVGYAPQAQPKIYAEKLLQQQQQQQLHQQQQAAQQLHHQQQQLQAQIQQQQLLESQFNHQAPTSGGYFTNQAVITHQNGYAHPVYDGNKDKDVSVIKDEYSTPSTGGYVVLGGGATAGSSNGDAGLQRSCDSVRSDAAESSCSSLSSAEDVLIIPNNLSGSETANVLVYDGVAGDASGVNVRHGVVVAVGGGGGGSSSAVAVSGGAPIIAPAQHQQVPASIPVPHGWKRLITNGVVIYIR